MPPPETPKRERYNPQTYLLTPTSEQSQRAAEKYGTPRSNEVERGLRPFEEVPSVHGFPALEEYADDDDYPLYAGAPQGSPSLKRKRDSSSDSDTPKAQKLNSPPSTIRRLDFGTSSTGSTASGVRQPQTPSPRKVLLGPATPTSTTSSRTTLSPNGDGNYPITTSVLSTLSSSSLNPSTRQSVREIINSYALRVSGIEKGRDISRLALKKKDEKIAELERRIQELEQERELDKR